MTNESMTTPLGSEEITRGGSGPVFIAGPDRSGTTLMYTLLASHPNISMVRRTNMWRYFHERYGDLSDPANLDRCLDEMLRYRRMRHLQPDGERIRREFLEGPPTYGRLFALFHQHNAQRVGRSRWGDKSLHTELFADSVFQEFPDARIIHMLRDPRDRYASVSRRNGQELDRVGPATARWLVSARAGRRNADRYRDRYRLVRFEDLARDPDSTMRAVCRFIGEPFFEEMMSMNAVPEHRDAGGNSSFADGTPGSISTRPVGRYREVLTPEDIAFIQLAAGRELEHAGYEPDRTRPANPIKFLIWYVPRNVVRMVGWTVLLRMAIWRGIRVPSHRLDPDFDAVGDDDE
jgi:hypothetical protein